MEKIKCVPEFFGSCCSKAMLTRTGAQTVSYYLYNSNGNQQLKQNFHGDGIRHVNLVTIPIRGSVLCVNLGKCIIYFNQKLITFES